MGLLAGRLRDGLATLGGLGVRGWDGGREQCGIVTFSVDGAQPAEVVDAVSRAGVNINWSEASSALFDMRPPRPDAVVRASPHYFNTEDEVDLLLDLVSGIAAPDPAQLIARSPGGPVVLARAARSRPGTLRGPCAS